MNDKKDPKDALIGINGKADERCNQLFWVRPENGH